MGLLHREDSITGIRLRDAQKTKIATSAKLVDGSIVLQLPEGGVCTGTTVKFCAPCDCTAVSGGVSIAGKVYTIVDACGMSVTGVGGVWSSGAEIAVVMDCEKSVAFIQNAATVGVKEDIDAHIRDKSNPHDVDATQTYVSGNCIKHNDLPAPCNVDNALMDLKAQIDSVRDRFSATSAMAAWRMYKKGIVYTDESVETHSWYELLDVEYEIASEFEIVDGQITLVNPTKYVVQWSIEENPNGPIDTAYAYDEPIIPAGCFLKFTREMTTPYSNNVYMAMKDTRVMGYGSSDPTSAGWSSRVYVGDLQRMTYTDIFAGRITNPDPNAYPENGMVGDTLYIRDGNPFALIPSMEMGTYSGVGKSGSNGTNALSFLIKPHLIIITGSSGTQAMFVRGSNKSGDVTITWDDNGLQWYANTAEAQLNTSGETYAYVAIGQEVKSE